MDNFKLLETIIKDMCAINKIDFECQHIDFLQHYLFRFKKLDDTFNLIITERELHIKPFVVIKAEIEHAINVIIGRI